jgi:hypothetical protein
LAWRAGRYSRRTRQNPDWAQTARSLRSKRHAAIADRDRVDHGSQSVDEVGDDRERRCDADRGTFRRHNGPQRESHSPEEQPEQDESEVRTDHVDRDEVGIPDGIARKCNNDQCNADRNGLSCQGTDLLYENGSALQWIGEHHVKYSRTFLLRQ